MKITRDVSYKVYQNTGRSLLWVPSLLSSGGGRAVCRGGRPGGRLKFLPPELTKHSLPGEQDPAAQADAWLWSLLLAAQAVGQVSEQRMATPVMRLTPFEERHQHLEC